MTRTVIPPTSPGEDYLAHASQIDAAVRRVMMRGHYVLDVEVAAFESEFAHYHGVPHAIGVGNGTDAITIALRALDVGPGDAVVTVSHTATATVAGIRATGAIPVFVDVDDEWGLMDADCLRECLEAARDGRSALPIGRYKAIVVVHLYGRCADMDAICRIAATYGLKVIEDCAQAHGAITRQGHLAGTRGSFGTFSFYPTKNLGAIGDGGAMITSDSELAERAHRIRQYGWNDQRVSSVEGINSRLDEIQAAILRVKLPLLDLANQRRAEIAARYTTMLHDTALRLPRHEASGRHVYHQFATRMHEREALLAFLREKGIETMIHYPIPVHLQPAYAASAVVPSGGLSNSERWANEEVSLPMFPQLTNEQVARVGIETLGFLGSLR